MKHIRFIAVSALIVFALVFGLPMATEAVESAKGQPAVIAVVDMRTVLQASNAGKDIHRQLETQRKKYEAQISQQEKDLQSAEKTLLGQRKSLDEAAFNKKRAAFEKDLMKAQKLVYERKKNLDTALNASLNKLKAETTKIIADLAQEKGVTAVFSNESVILAEKSMDLTSEVVKRLNSKVKKIQVDWSAKK